jgi:long-subunit fatty acid transport protein
MSAALLMAASSVTGQTQDEQLLQDALDLQARANVVQGSGARAFGMGGAFLARADDATAASWNPAGLSYLRLPEVSFVYSGGSLNSLEVSPTRHKDDRRNSQEPDFFAATYPFEFRGLGGAVQISFQRLIPFGAERTLDESDPETGDVFRHTDVSAAGGYDVIAFGTGIALARNLRAGATINRWFNGYHQTLDRNTLRNGVPGHTTQESDYDLSGWNVNLGLIWSPHPDLNVGAVFKTPFTGDVVLTKSRVDSQEVTPPVPPRTNEASSPDPDLGLGPVTLELPAAVGLGVSWRPRSRLTVSADYTYSYWSKGKIHNFFTLPQPVAGATPTPYPTLPYPTLDPSVSQHDTEQVRGGVEFVFILGRVKVPVRAGAFSDGQYIEDFYKTAPRFTGFSAGTGLAIGPLLVDFAYIRESGRYQAAAATPSTTVSVHGQRFVASAILRLPRR